MLEKIGLVLICCCLPVVVIGAVMLIITWALGSGLVAIATYIISAAVVVGVIGVMLLCLDMAHELLREEEK